MKNVTMNSHKMAARLVSIFTLVLFATITYAQDKGIDINVDLDKHDNWYANPIVWIIGAAVFILLLVALLRGGGNKS
ncbi:MAG TPA: hypothetical protein VFG10_15515 [Saprospiraceae bacterium]|nr:hypothetical protein [Saprospiraceae bacterium]